MGWGERQAQGAGTTGEQDTAHRELNAVGVPAGPLAVRATRAAAIIRDLRRDARLREAKG